MHVENKRVLPITEHWEWQFHAACRDADPELFFTQPNERGVSKRTREERAREVCATCAVIDRCGQFALARREEFGVWGAQTESERLAELTGSPTKRRRNRSRTDEHQPSGHSR